MKNTHLNNNFFPSTRSPSVDQEIKKPLEPKKSENEVHWEELVKNMGRPLALCDLDFTDLTQDDEKDMLAPRGLVGIPPPPPPNLCGPVPPPMNFPPAPKNLMPSFNSTANGKLNGEVVNGNAIKKNKKTVKLFWKEVRDDMVPVPVGGTIWDELPESKVDTQKLEHLFESRAKDLMTKVIFIILFSEKSFCFRLFFFFLIFFFVQASIIQI